MKFILSTFVLVGMYCLAAGLRPGRLRQMTGLRRNTQSKPLYSKGGFSFRRLKRMSTLILPCPHHFSLTFSQSGASNQIRRMGWAWNKDSNKGGPKFCGNGVPWYRGIGKFK